MLNYYTFISITQVPNCPYSGLEPTLVSLENCHLDFEMLPRTPRKIAWPIWVPAVRAAD